jgi:hypothetical protein
MANDISSNPWHLDSTGVVYVPNVKIKRLVWSEQATVGDVLLISDRNGKPIVSSKAYAANFNQEFAYDGWFNGLTVTTLASGIVMVYLSF